MTATQTDDLAEFLAHYEDCPQCIDCDKTAKYWLKSHGCNNGLFCEACKQECLDFINNSLADGWEVECLLCHRRFSSIQDALTVIPL